MLPVFASSCPSGYDSAMVAFNKVKIGYSLSNSGLDKLHFSFHVSGFGSIFYIF